MDSLQDAITTKVTELLKNNSYLYKDLNASESKKAFHSNFIIHLLAMTYIPSIKGHVHVEGIDTIVPLYSSIKGILDLCSAAVVLFFCMKQFIDSYFEKQIKRRLQFISVVELEALIKGKLHYTLPSHSTNRLAEQQQVNIHSLTRNRKMLHKGSLVQQSIALMSSLQAFLRKHNLLSISLSRMLVVRMWTLKHLRMNMLKFVTNPNILCHVLIS